MTSVKYGLMQKETQEFMGVYNQSEYSRGTLSMDASKRFEEDNLVNVVAFLKAEGEKAGYTQWHFDTNGHNPEEFVPVAFIRSENGFSKTEDVKQIELPEIVRCKMKQARKFKDTPPLLRNRYFSAELLEAMQGLDVEAYVVIPEKGHILQEGETIYINQSEKVIGEVKMVSPVSDDWPVHDTVFEREGWQFVLVERGTKALEAKAILSDIEPVSPAPGL
jgi:hypothetical protein